MRLWSSRFEQELALQTLHYTQTIDIDQRLLSSDLWGSLGHVLMLSCQHIVPEEDGRRLVAALLDLQSDAEAGRLHLDVANEDVHLNIENWLIERLGLAVGGKLHTARSRNDQVVTAARLYLREQLLAVADEIGSFAEELLVQADAHRETIMLGHTHSQPAQPMSYGFWLSGHASVLVRDIRRLLNAFETVNENPLGACAIAGTSFPIDRELTKRLLGFDRLLLHALDATSSRDFMAEAVAALSILMGHLSRLAEEIVLWSGFEFQLLEVGDQFATGSSIMPQKKNPVVAELARARSGSVLSCFVELMTVLKSVTMGYSTDLQQDKPAVWRALDITLSTATIMRAQMQTVKLNKDLAVAHCWDSFATATELANHLAASGLRSFREGYQIVGELIKILSAQGKTLRDASIVQALLAERGIQLTSEVIAEITSPQQVLARQTSDGSTGPEAVKNTIHLLRQEVASLVANVTEKRQRIRSAFEETRQIAAKFSAGDAIGKLIDDHGKKQSSATSSSAAKHSRRAI